jgi:hypothetical protein
MANDPQKVQQPKSLHPDCPEDELHLLIDSIQRRIRPVDSRALARDVDKAVREVRKRNAGRPS